MTSTPLAPISPAIPVAENAPDLSQLRDIHLPDAVSWWPLAPGWWILLALAIASAVLGFFLYRKYIANRWRRAALAELNYLRDSEQLLSPQRQLAQLSVLLRRVAIQCFPRIEVASLYGETWLIFLGRALGQPEAFQSGAGRMLDVGPYMRAVAIDMDDLSSLFALAEQWIKTVTARSPK
jgi:hypothetical protein